MPFQFLTNMPLAQAREEYLALLRETGAPRRRTETVETAASNRRVTAQAVYAHICAPHYPAAAMDGIAIRAKDSFGASETAPVELAPGSFLTVDTGDPIPERCDAVVMAEELVHLEDGGVRLHAPATPWQHIRQVGEDICAGEMLVPALTPVTPAAVGALFAGGVLRLEVLCRPRIGIIPTGDEIVPPTDDPKSGDIIEFNSSIFSAMLRDWEAEPVVYPIVPDDPAALKAAAAKALEECDAVLLNAGSSAGREDYSAAVIAGLGQVFCHGVAIRPGKPAVLGLAEGKPILCVPGYPVSGILVLEQLVKPLIEAWYGVRAPAAETVEASLTRRVVSGLKYEEFVRVRLGSVGGRIMASPLNRGAGVVSSFMKADGILTVPQGVEGYEAGAEVTVRLLRPREQLEGMLVAIGSHDPLLDELGDLLHLADPSLYMSSSHVGSMGGIMAVRRGETHIAGVHLLDEETGEYNLSYIRKYFPSGGVRLVRCVERTQGLMLAGGNPLGIHGLEDLAREGLRYVNRQKGSGTRILIDYLCRARGIDTAKIYGYEREEFTHTSVAAQIASGSADAGMGIYSAAQIYGLDFLPVCMEEYDLLIPEAAWDTPAVRKALEILKSEAFRARIEALGGYRLDRPGEEREL